MTAKRFRNICTAVAGSVGTGNITGVALAMALGGAGAVFWMWVSAIVGMAVKAREVRLGARYGGAMGYMPPRAAKAYAALMALGAFGIGNALQAAAISEALRPLRLSMLVPVALPLAVLLLSRRRAGALGVLVPAMAALYLGGAWWVILRNADAIPAAFGAIFAGASEPRAVLVGLSRGIMSHEAGLGSAALAHADGEGRGADGAVEVFADTVLVSTTTALMLLVTAKPDARSAAAELPFAEGFVAASLTLFALSSILSWQQYGESCAAFLGLDRRRYTLVFCAALVPFSLIKPEKAAVICDILNLLPASINLRCLYKKGR